MSKAPDLSAFPIPRKGMAQPILADDSSPPSSLPPPPSSPAAHRVAREMPPVRGEVIATTVKLDGERYLRLLAVGAPAPGRLRRRSIQDMIIEALDDWLAKQES